MADRSADGDQDDSPSARRDRMQRQAYRIWLNSHLQKIGDDADHIKLIDEGEPLERAFAEGTRLLALAQSITATTNTKALRRAAGATSDIARLDHINSALDVFSAKGFQRGRRQGMYSASALNFIEGERSEVLGFVWSLFHSFVLSEVEKNVTAGEGTSPGDGSEANGGEEDDGEDLILSWVGRILAPYGIEVNDYGASWQDGRAFSALIHSHAPVAGPDPATLDPNDREANLGRAFEIARDVYNVPQLLDPRDMATIESPDSKSVKMYTTLLFQALSTASRTAEVAGEDHEAEVAALRAEVAAVRVEMHEVEESLAAREASIAENEQALASTVALQVALREANDKLKADAQATSIELEAARAEISRLRAELAAETSAREAAEAKAAAVEADTAAVRAAADAEIAAALAAAKAAEDGVELSNSAITEYEIDALRDEKEALTERIQELEVALYAREEERDSSRLQQERLEQQQASLLLAAEKNVELLDALEVLVERLKYMHINQIDDGALLDSVYSSQLVLGWMEQSTCRGHLEVVKRRKKKRFCCVYDTFLLGFADNEQADLRPCLVLRLDECITTLSKTQFTVRNPRLATTTTFQAESPTKAAAWMDAIKEARVWGNKTKVVEMARRQNRSNDKKDPRVVRDPAKYQGLLLAHVEKHRTDKVKELIARGVDVNTPTCADGWSAVHVAAACGHADILSALVAKGASFSSRNGDGKTPIDLANENGHSSVVALLNVYEMMALHEGSDDEDDDLVAFGAGSVFEELDRLRTDQGTASTSAAAVDTDGSSSGADDPSDEQPLLTEV